MTIYLVIILFIISNSSVSKKVEIQCPSQCKCDLFEKYRRATCKNRTLVVFQAHLPKQTELLDLSYNQISELTKNIFVEEELLSLKLLNLSHNKVSHINLNAFTKLNQLKTLDLSHNVLQYLFPIWFVDLVNLEELYMSHNQFDKFTESVFASVSVKRIDFSFCHLSYISNEAFKDISNLEVLDLTGNNLIQIDVNIISELSHFQVFHLINNPISCNDKSIAVSQYCLQNGIRYGDPCRKTDDAQKSNKFERIVMSEPEDEQNSWIYEEEEEKGEHTTISIVENQCTNQTEHHDNLLMRIINLSPTLTILITFIYGIAVGIVIGCSVNIKSRKRSESEENRDEYPLRSNRNSRIFNNRPYSSLKRSNSLFSRRPPKDLDLYDSLVLEEYANVETSPVPTRKSFG